jgi:threonine aldolase
MEYHHAGRLPKRYGGGMKKTYFLNARQIVFCARNWQKICEEFFESLKA